MSTRASLLAVAAFLAASSLARAGEPEGGGREVKEKRGESRFMVELAHAEADCATAAADLADGAPDAAGRALFGCEAGDHRGWMVVSARDEAEVRARLPEAFRAAAKVTKVSRVAREAAKAGREKRKDAPPAPAAPPKKK